MENLTIAHAWVLEGGHDCDGVYTRGKYWGLPNLLDAEVYCDYESEWSDGNKYRVTEKWSEVLNYCAEFDIFASPYADKYAMRYVKESRSPITK